MQLVKNALRTGHTKKIRNTFSDINVELSTKKHTFPQIFEKEIFICMNLDKFIVMPFLERKTGSEVSRIQLRDVQDIYLCYKGLSTYIQN